MAAPSPPFRYAYLTLAYGCVGIGAAGVVVPMLPTTPFLLVAAWAATRSSPRLRWWLYRHPRYGPSIRAWHRDRSVPVPAKIAACFLLTLSWVTLWLLGTDIRVLTGLTFLFLVIATWILTRPSVPVAGHQAGKAPVAPCRLNR